ncbi:Cyclin-dependent kinase 10 [Lasiodiplodia hormozganensis]|uniref:cyclin-dependent kinase n=1 Tax=Lasiodiplodia hormozganensis TaxID=869390 RepID=A0AA40CIS0_9PEZI|nr:Cyclin-dependent kinase 10 [Lasiodiplodia hormozganensis]
MDDTPECADHVSVTGHKIDLSLDHGFLGNCSSIASYESLDAIGEGAYGIVSRARDRRSGSVVALKQIRILEYERNNGIPLTALREISILRSLRHQNVINVLEVAVDDAVLEDVYMVMEYCEKAVLKDLASLIDVHKVQFSLAEVKCLARQLLEGLEYLHRKDIIHRDIKMENLLLTANGLLKIADFGLAREWAPRPLTPGVVTIWYRAPELLLGCSRYTSSIDIWSAGLFIGELLLQMPVLDGNTELEQLSQIAKLLGSPSPGDIVTLSSMGCPDLIKWQRDSMPRGRVDNLERWFLSRSTKGTVKFLASILKWDPKARLTANEALGKSKSRFAAAAEDWWRESPRAAAKEQLPTLPAVEPVQDGKPRLHNDSSSKRQQAPESGPVDFGGFVFDFGDAEPATKLPPRKRRR